MSDVDVDIAAILGAYTEFESAQQDTWSPLHNDKELWHRVRLLLEMCRMLRSIPMPVASLKVIDVGCGVGRSSRLLVDLGVNPRNVVGIDFRKSAIRFAQEVNPAIRFKHIIDLDHWPTEEFNLAVQCTAFSSIPGIALREKSANLMSRSVGESGYILWWDILKVNTFAGGDPLDPLDLFSTRKLIKLKKVSLQPRPEDCIRPLRGFGPRFAAALNTLSHRPTHCIALFGSERIKN